MKKTTLFIEVQGGVVQDVWTTEPNIMEHDIVIVDYDDLERAEDDRIDAADAAQQHMARLQQRGEIQRTSTETIFEWKERTGR